MEIEENIGIGELIPENEVDGNNLIDYEAEIKDLNSVKIYQEPNLDRREFKPVVNTDEKDPFGW